MSWPRTVDYSAAVQNPSHAFADADLVHAAPVLGLFQAPLTYSGNLACVFKLEGAKQRAWAVKCFTRPVTNMPLRYAQVSAHLDRYRKKFAVAFQYLTQGIRVGGAWYPIVKMDWVDGLPLNDFLGEHAGNVSLLEQLCQLWQRLASEMRRANLAHGDLQHGNVLLVEGSKAATMAVRLIDYDGMWVPALHDKPPDEVGHPNYQHPERLRDGGYGREIDRFSHLVIYTALRCLLVGGRPLWERYDTGENLLFGASDWQEPAHSKLLPELLALGDASTVSLVGHLLLASQGPLAEVPLLDDLVRNALVVPLSDQQQARLRELVPDYRPVAQAGDRPKPPPLPTTGIRPPPLPGQDRPRVPPLPVPRSRSAVRLIVSLCCLGGLLLGSTAAALWLQGSSRQPDVQLPQPLPAQVPTIRPTLGEVAAIRIQAGTSRVVVCPVQANGNTEGWKVSFADLPSGVRQRPLPSSPDEARVEVLVASGVAASVTRITVVLHAGGQEVDRQTVPLVIEKAISQPRIVRIDLEIPTGIRLKAGARTRVVIDLERNGYLGPVSLEADRLPAGVTAGTITVPAGRSTAEFELRASEEIRKPFRLAMQPFRVIALVDGKQVGQREAQLFLERDRPEEPRRR